MYEIIAIKRGQTNKGANCWDLLVHTEIGDEHCAYFGNTKPRKVLAIKTEATKMGVVYKIAIIQPHTSRDQKTGRFKQGWRTE